MMRAVAGRVARALFRGDGCGLELRPGEIVVAGRRGGVRLPRAAVADVAASRGLLWDSVRIRRRDGGAPVRVRGLRRGAADAIVLGWAACGVAPLAAAAARDFVSLLDRDAYFNRRALTTWRATAGALDGRLAAAFDALPLPPDVLRDIRDARRFLADAEQIVDARNDRYVREKMAQHLSWFARAGGQYGLTPEQQEAVLRDEDSCLVVAGAGTGKTSTVAGKVGYLLRTGAAEPERILLLSFTRKAAEEMADRLRATVGEDIGSRVTVRTFHSLGVEILARADGRKPSLSVLAEDGEALAGAMATYVRALFEDPATRAEAAAYFAYCLFPYRSPFEFATPHEYHQYVRSHDLRTLRGEKVKSHEELEIANWLHLNGVDYAYERPYPHDTATVQHRQYKPDFYFPTHDVYLEHFGVGLDGTTAPGVDQAAYHAGMEWKRQLHQRHGTLLVETYSHERAAGTLLTSLEAKLRAAGITPRPLPPEAVLAGADEQRLIEPVAKLLGAFLSLYKGNLWALAELETAARAPAGPSHPRRDPARALAFLRVFRGVLARYEADLARAREIDFNDMIAAATERVETGRYRSPFTHVIVDEFQDLSRGRGRLLKALLGRAPGRALLAPVPDRRLFCVGDDWQSIYRFTGSDIAQMTRFAEEFGFARRCDLTRTHRFNQELLEASSRFVQENPAQLRKTLVAGGTLDGPAVEVHASEPSEDAGGLLDRVLARVAECASREWTAPAGAPTARPAVLVLGRYNFAKPQAWTRLQRRHGGLALEFLTVHRAKGLEADYTVLLDVTAGRMGFPSEVVDDPLLDLVLAGTGEFPNAEERRVFYVALTRARTRCFVLTDATKRSTFVDEIEGEAYRAWVTRADATDSTGSPAAPRCSTCGGGALVRRQGEYGAFYGCSNYPLCDGKARLCPACGAGALVRDRAVFRCSRAACGHTASVCPSCRHGMLLVRKGPRGQFYGCSEWRPEPPSCAYTGSLNSAPPAGGRRSMRL